MLRPDGHGGTDIDAAPLQIAAVESQNRSKRKGKSEGQPKESQPKQFSDFNIRPRACHHARSACYLSLPRRAASGAAADRTSRAVAIAVIVTAAALLSSRSELIAENAELLRNRIILRGPP